MRIRICSPTTNPYGAAAPYASAPYGATAYAPGAVHSAKDAQHVPDAFAAPGSDALAVSSSNYIESMEKSVRMGFVRKVYAILAVQLLITFGITFLFCFNETCVGGGRLPGAICGDCCALA